MQHGFRGWKLVSLYTNYGTDGKQVFIDFAHYTGRPGRHGGSEYDMTLSGTISIDDFRKVLRRWLELKRIPISEQ